MSRYKIFVSHIFILIVALSCSIKSRISDHDFKKIVNAVSEKEQGNIFFENDNAKVYFDKYDVIKALSIIKNQDWVSYCKRLQIEEYEARIRNSNYEINLFNDLSENTLDYCGELEGRILEELLLNYNFVIFNKEKKQYEPNIRYSKWGDKYGCCFAGFYFANNARFIMTRVVTDLVIREECDSIQNK